MRKETGAGIVILLEPGTVVKKKSKMWLWCQTLNVKRGHTRLFGVRKVPFLRILNAEVTFLPGGVHVKMEGCGEFRRAFWWRSVLEVRDLQMHLLRRNHDLCERCGTLTGEVVASAPSSQPVGKTDAVLKCRTCHNQWGRKI